MGKFRLTVKTSFGEMSVEGDSPTDLRNMLLEIGISEESINNILAIMKQKLQTPEQPISISIAPSKPELAGVIEYGSDGAPHITVPTHDLTGTKVIGLILYARSPNPVSLSELTELVANNWRSVAMSTISGYLAAMKAFVIKEGSRGSYSYKLSGAGKNWIENEVLPKLKQKKSESF
jgi:hypothetical protein